MLNQPPVSLLTLAMTENYEICCHKKCTKSFVGWGSAPDLAYIVYILYTYICCVIGPPPYYKIVPRPMKVRHWYEQKLQQEDDTTQQVTKVTKFCVCIIAVLLNVMQLLCDCNMSMKALLPLVF